MFSFTKRKPSYTQLGDAENSSVFPFEECDHGYMTLENGKVECEKHPPRELERLSIFKDLWTRNKYLRKRHSDDPNVLEKLKGKINKCRKFVMTYEKCAKDDEYYNSNKNECQTTWKKAKGWNSDASKCVSLLRMHDKYKDYKGSREWMGNKQYYQNNEGIPYFKAVLSSYKKKADEILIGDPLKNEGVFENILDTVGVDVFLNREQKMVLVAFKGTTPTTLRDLQADAKIALNQLKDSPRYMVDRQNLRAIVKEYPPDRWSYRITGHSLGGAMATQFMRELVENPRYKNLRKNTFGLTFNSAVQKHDISDKNEARDLEEKHMRRVYIDEDFLYNWNKGNRFQNVAELKYVPHRLWTFLSKRISSHLLGQPSFAEYANQTEGYVNKHSLFNFPS